MVSRTYWRRVGAVLGVVLGAALAVAGCSSSSPAASGGPVTLTIWNDINQVPTGTPASKFWEVEAIHQFEAMHKNIQVKTVTVPGDAGPAFATLLKSSEVAGNTPDIAELFAGGQVLENANYLLPLNSYISPSFKKSLYIGWQFATSGFKTDGTIYGVPYGAGNYYFVYYNKALFKKAGLSASSFPTTWPSLVSLAQKLKSQGILPFQFGEKDGVFGAWTQDALISSEVGNQGVINMYFGQTPLDSTPIVRAYQAWHQLYADGLTNSDVLSLEATQSWSQFAKGNGAMTISGPFADSSIAPSPQMEKNVGLFPVPALPGAAFPNVLSGGPNNDYVIFKNTSHPAEAMELIKYLTSQKVQEMALAQGFGQLPNNAAYNVGPSLQQVDPLLAEAYPYIRNPHYVLAEAFDNVMPGSIDSYWYQTNAGVFSGSLAPSSAAKSLEDQMRIYLSTSTSS